MSFQSLTEGQQRWCWCNTFQQTIPKLRTGHRECSTVDCSTGGTTRRLLLAEWRACRHRSKTLQCDTTQNLEWRMATCRWCSYLVPIIEGKLNSFPEPNLMYQSIPYFEHMITSDRWQICQIWLRSDVREQLHMWGWNIHYQILGVSTHFFPLIIFLILVSLTHLLTTIHNRFWHMMAQKTVW